MAFNINQSSQMEIGTMTQGVSYQGVQNYIEELRGQLLVTVKEKLDDTANMQAAIDAGWQGKSRDDFYKDFNKSIERIGADLEDEWHNLEAKIFELADNLFKQDKNMY